MLEVDAGRLQEAPAIEIGTDAYLHAVQPFLQQHAALGRAAQHERQIEPVGCSPTKVGRRLSSNFSTCRPGLRDSQSRAWRGPRRRG
jgi:hypothetical protein